MHMTTNLSEHIKQTALCDTHEHLRREPDWIDDGPRRITGSLR